MIADLTDEADQATRLVGFYKAVIDNEDIPARLNGSAAGFAGMTAIVGVRVGVVLYCCRAWDQSRDAISLPNARAMVPSPQQLIERHRAVGDEARRIETRHEEFVAAFERAKSSGSLPKLRVLRTEWFAHRVRESWDRRTFEGAGQALRNPTHAETVAFAEATVDLVGWLNLLWHRRSIPHSERIERATGQARAFWRLVPVLKDVETIET